MSGKAVLIVGARGMGKTTTTKKLLTKTEPKARLVLDVNGEYMDLYPYPFIGFEEFSKKLTTVSNAVIVVEEATIFLSNRGYDKDITDVLVKARHRNNTIIMVYHSIRNVPKYIFDLCNMVVLHKTNDSEKAVDEKDNDKLKEGFIWLKKQPMLKGENGKEYSPQKVIDLY